jgi:hypothetical protein
MIVGTVGDARLLLMRMYACEGNYFTDIRSHTAEKYFLLSLYGESSEITHFWVTIATKQNVNTTHERCVVGQKPVSCLLFKCVKSQSHIATDGQSVSKSWCQAPSGVHDQIFITV